MSTKSLNTGIDNLFNLKSGTARKHHNRLRSHSVMHQLLKPKPVDAVGAPGNAAEALNPASAAAELARDEEIRRKTKAAQTGGYAANILAGRTGGSDNTAARMLYGS